MTEETQVSPSAIGIEVTISDRSLSCRQGVVDSSIPNVADCMVREGVGNDFKTDPESENAVEIFNWRLISSWFQSVSKS